MNWSTKWDEGEAANKVMKALGVAEINSFNTPDGILTLEVIGDLGLDWSDDGWMIYHLPTGTRFGKAVPGIYYDDKEGDYNPENYAYDCKPLLNWMRKVQDTSEPELVNITDAWRELASLTPNNYRDNAMQAKEIINKWCLSVKVE